MTRRRGGAHARRWPEDREGSGLTKVRTWLLEGRDKLANRELGKPDWGLLGFVAAALAVAVLMIVGLVVWIPSWMAGKEPAAQAQQLTAKPPAEWSSTPKWVSPPLLGSAGRALVIDSNRVGLVSAERELLLVDADSGEPVWTRQLPGGDVHTQLVRTTIDGQAVVSAQVGGKLCWWNLESGQEGGLDLPAGANVSFLGQAPLVGLSQSQVGVVRNGTVQPVDVPAGAAAYAARVDGSVLATSSQGWWVLKPGQPAGQPTAWVTPLKVASQPVTLSYSGGYLLNVVAGRVRYQLLAYQDQPAGARFAFAASMHIPVMRDRKEQLRWSASPSGTWGILELVPTEGAASSGAAAIAPRGALVDLRRGTVQDLGAWKTRFVATDRALGTIGDQQVLVGPKIGRGVLQDGEGFPEDTVGQNALVRATEGNQERLYLLPPK